MPTPQELHNSLDQLFAEFISANPDLPTYTNAPIIDLIDWSHKRTQQCGCGCAVGSVQRPREGFCALHGEQPAPKSDQQAGDG